MDICHPRRLKNHANDALGQAAYSPKKAALIHIGIYLAAPLIITLISLILNKQITTSGGLDSIGTRAMFSTAQMALDIAYSICAPFWMAGFLSVALKISRNQTFSAGTLLDGFRRFGPLLRLQLLEGLFYMAVVSFCFYPGLLLSMPFLGEMMEIIQPLVDELSVNPNADVMAFMEQIPEQDLLRAAAPAMIAIGGLSALVIGYVSFRARFARYLIIDNPRTGALAGVFLSFRMTKKNCLKLIGLDLSFWWYYLLNAGIFVLSLTDVILSAAGVTLPLSENVVSLLGYGVYALAFLALYVWAMPRVETTYATAYGVLFEQMPPLPQFPGKEENL